MKKTFIKIDKDISYQSLLFYLNNFKDAEDIQEAVKNGLSNFAILVTILVCLKDKEEIAFSDALKMSSMPFDYILAILK